MKRGATVSAGVTSATPVALALFVSQPTAYPGYPVYMRCTERVTGANAPVVALERVLYTGQPWGTLTGQCAKVLFSPVSNGRRNFLSGLRTVATDQSGLVLYVGDCKRNYQNVNEAGKTLVVVQGGPEPYRPAYLLIFVLKRLYARKRPSFNARYAQQFFRAYVRPKLTQFLTGLPGGVGNITQLSELRK